MALASKESIDRLIANSGKTLATLEGSYADVLSLRKAVEKAKEQTQENSVVLDLLAITADVILTSTEVSYDLSASLKSMLMAKDVYAKRFCMQSLNLCFCESVCCLVGSDGNGLLTKLEASTKETSLTGCQFLTRHIINDIQLFADKFPNRNLRNITRHYSDPIRMYGEYQKLTDEDFFAKGVNELLAIIMEIHVVTSYVLSIMRLCQTETPSKVNSPAPSLDIQKLLNNAIFVAFEKRNVKDELNKTIQKGQSAVDECYGLYRKTQGAKAYLQGGKIEDVAIFGQLQSLVLLRMQAVYMKSDLACAVWSYLNAESDKERSQSLRMIHITKQAALTHLYGYNEKTRKESLWNRIKDIAETKDSRLDAESVESAFKELTKDLKTDSKQSRVFTHYRHKDELYLPARLDALKQMNHRQELEEVLQLFGLCNKIDTYLHQLLTTMNKTQDAKTKKQRDEYLKKIDDMAAMVGNDERAKHAFDAIKGFINSFFV